MNEIKNFQIASAYIRLPKNVNLQVTEGAKCSNNALKINGRISLKRE
jgi:hypothetical protein